MQSSMSEDKTTLSVIDLGSPTKLTYKCICGTSHPFPKSAPPVHDFCDMPDLDALPAWRSVAIAAQPAPRYARAWAIAWHFAVLGLAFHCLWMALLVPVVWAPESHIRSLTNTTSLSPWTQYATPGFSEQQFLACLVFPAILFAIYGLRRCRLLPASPCGGVQLFVGVGEYLLALFPVMIPLLMRMRTLSPLDFYGPYFCSYSFSSVIPWLALIRILTKTAAQPSTCHPLADQQLIVDNLDRLMLSVLDVGVIMPLVAIPEVQGPIANATLAFIVISLAAHAGTFYLHGNDHPRERKAMRLSGFAVHLHAVLCHDLPFLIIRILAFQHTTAVTVAITFKNLLAILNSIYSMIQLWTV